MTTVKDFLGFVINPPPGDSQSTAQGDRLGSIVTGGGGGGGLPSGWLDVKAYGGAKGDGATDDSAAIQATINAVHAAGGGTVYFPPGIYMVGTSLSMDQMGGITLTGAGGAAQFQILPSKLRYTGTTTGVSGGLLHLNSAFGIEICYLALEYTNLGFTGDLVTLDGAPFGSDCQDFHIHHCTSHTTAAGIPARSIVRISKSVIGQIDHCHFGNGLNAIRLGDAGGPYVNVVLIEACTFNSNSNGHIYIGTADGESITIRDCSFEGYRAIYGTTLARDGAQCVTYSPNIEDCWFGDAGGSVTWIDGLSGSFGAIRGNYFGSTAGTHLSLVGSWLVEANEFVDGTYVYDSPISNGLARLIAFMNYYNLSSGAVFNAATFPQGAPVSEYMSLGNSGVPATGWANQHSSRLGFKAVSGTIGAAVADGELVIGARVNGGFEPASNQALIYKYITNAADGSVPALVLQAPKTTAGFGLVRIIGGAGPTSVIDAGSQSGTLSLSFFGANPVAQAARAGQLTDSTGGAVSATLAAGITDTVAKNAIASLAAKVNALEAIIHNLGLSA